MTPTIVARHFTVSEALRTHIGKSAARLPKFLDNIIACHVALSVEKYRRISEVTVNASGHTFKATGSSHSLYLSIDDAFEKLIRQVKKQNENGSWRCVEFLHASRHEQDINSSKVLNKEGDMQETRMCKPFPQLSAMGDYLV